MGATDLGTGSVFLRPRPQAPPGNAEHEALPRQEVTFLRRVPGRARKHEVPRQSLGTRWHSSGSTLRSQSNNPIGNHFRQCGVLWSGL